jgi:hypothetical protein
LKANIEELKREEESKIQEEIEKLKNGDSINMKKELQ